MGTNGGLERFTQGRFITVGAPEGLSDPYARSVFQDRAGNIWIGTAHGLNRFSGGKVTTYAAKDGLSNDYILCVTEGKDGAIWVGTPTGLNRMKDGRVDRFDVAGAGRHCVKIPNRQTGENAALKTELDFEMFPGRVMEGYLAPYI